MKLKKIISICTSAILLTQNFAFTSEVFASNNTHMISNSNLIELEQKEIADQKESHMGLVGWYFKDQNFIETTMIAPMSTTGSNLYVNLNDSLIQNKVYEEFKSVRWLGYIKPYESGEYNFTISENADNTAIHIKNELILNTNNKTVYLEENKMYPITIEYISDKGTILADNDLRLDWSVNGLESVPIPIENLYAPNFSQMNKENLYSLIAYPETSLFGVKMPQAELDSDGDSIPDTWEKSGYTRDPNTGALVEWKDEYESLGLPKYVSNPFKVRTSGDPYTDSEKTLGRLPNSIDKLAMDPVVAAYPIVGVDLERIIMSKNINYSETEEYTTETSKSGDVTDSSNIDFNFGIGLKRENITETGFWSFVGDVLGFITGGFSYSSSHSTTSSTTVTNSTLDGRQISFNEADTGYINANIRYYNNGNATMYNVTPTTSLVIDNGTIATIKADPSNVGNSLIYGQSYPDKTQSPMSLNQLSGGEKITINYDQYNAINMGSTIKLETNQVEGTLPRINSQGLIDTTELWTPYLDEIYESDVVIVIDDGKEQVERKVVGKDRSNVYDSTPEITLEEAVIKAFGAKKEGNILIYNDVVIDAEEALHFYDDYTLKKITNQFNNDGITRIYDVKLEPGMKFLLKKFDHVDRVDNGTDLFEYTGLIETDNNGINDSLAYVNTKSANTKIRFSDRLITELDEKTSYLLTAYIKTESDAHIIVCPNLEYGFNTNVIKYEIKGNEWHNIYIPLYTEHPINQLYDYIEISVMGGGIYYLDNISITKILGNSVPTGSFSYGDELIINSTFDNQNFLDGWESEGEVVSIRIHGDPAISIQSDESYPFSYISQDINVEKNAFYLVRMATENANGEFGLSIHLGDINASNSVDSHMYLDSKVAFQSSNSLLINTLDFDTLQLEVYAKYLNGEKSNIDVGYIGMSEVIFN